MSSFTPHSFGRDDNKSRRDASYHRRSTPKAREHGGQMNKNEPSNKGRHHPPPEFEDVWDSDDENGCASLYSGATMASGPFKPLAENDTTFRRPLHSRHADGVFPQRIASYARSVWLSLVLYARQIIRRNDRARWNEEFRNCIRSMRQYSASYWMVSLLFLLYIPISMNSVNKQNQLHLQKIRTGRNYAPPLDLPPIGGFESTPKNENNNIDPELSRKKNPLSDSLATFDVAERSKSSPLLAPVNEIPRSKKGDVVMLDNNSLDAFETDENLVPDMEARHFAKLQGLDPRTLKVSALRPTGDGLKLLHEFPSDSESGIPFYWHIPKAGGSTMKQIMSVCYKLATACEVGLSHGLVPIHPPQEKGELKVMVDQGGVKYVNVQVTNPAGIQYAKENNLAASGLVDVVSTHLFTGSLQLFTEDNKGKVFTIFRNPIERAVSMFYYLGSDQAKHERTYDPTLSIMTIEEFAKSSKIENNWLTRSLNGGLVGKIDRKHTAYAKKVLQTKFLIGLLPQLDESMRRFEKYFGWQDKSSNNHSCVNDLVSSGMNKNTAKKTVEEWSKEYVMLLRQNSFDMEIFHYAEELF